jgi:hypothetical protein
MAMAALSRAAGPRPERNVTLLRTLFTHLQNRVACEFLGI